MRRSHDSHLNMLPEMDGRYMTINIVARRARVLNRQNRGQQNFDESAMFDPLEIALGEYKINKLKFDLSSKMEEDHVEDYRSMDS